MSWAEFKALVDTWKIKSLIRFTPKDGNGHYQNIWVNFEGRHFEVSGFLMAGSAELTDFEMNYKPDPNMTWVTGKDVLRNDIASTFAVTANTTTPHDIKMLADTWLWGGDIIVQGSSVVDGDQVEVQLVDVDNITGAGAGTVLRTIITKKFIPGSRSISVAAPDGTPSCIPGGLYLRFNYVEVSNVGKTADVNLVAMS